MSNLWVHLGDSSNSTGVSMCKDQINLILKKIMFQPSSHNEIYAKHLKTFIQICIEDETKEWKIIKYKASATLGVGDRYIKQYLKGLTAWGICDLSEDDHLFWKIDLNTGEKIEIPKSIIPLPDKIDTKYDETEQLSELQCTHLKYKNGMWKCFEDPDKGIPETCNICKRKKLKAVV